MNKLLLAGTFALTLISGASSADAAVYLPTGPQTNVALSTVTGGGWSLCFRETYGTYGTSISSALAGCSGSKLMMAGRMLESDQLIVLAQADLSDVTYFTGSGSNATHNANGTNWYYDPDYSWGFADGSQNVLRSSCDASGVFNGDSANGDKRLCWHTGGGALQGGWRAGNNVWLNSSPDYERVLFTFNGGVPEPATWALMIGGFGIAGVALRRRRAVVA